MLTAEQKSEIIKKYQRKEGDSGSTCNNISKPTKKTTTPVVVC